MAGFKLRNGADLNSKNITNMADGVSANDAVTLQQLQAAVRGLNWKEEVRCRTTANVNLSSALTNGSTFDGVTVATGDRVLVMAQTAGEQNGIYTVVASGAASRTADADSAAELNSCAVFVTEGTLYHDTMWVLQTDPPITLNTTSLTFAQFGGGASYTAGSNGGLQLSSNAFSILLDTAGLGAGLSLGAGGLKVDHSKVPMKYAADCAATTNPQTFAHGLGSVDLIVQVVAKGTPNVFVMPDISWDGTNIYIDWGGAPSAAEYRVVAAG